jgi:hypothetical protein
VVAALLLIVLVIVIAGDKPWGVTAMLPALFAFEVTRGLWRDRRRR